MKKPLILLTITILLSSCSSLFSSTTNTESEEKIDYLATSWEDRSVFQGGLVESQQGVLDELPGAPIYHMDMQIDSDMVHLSGEMDIRFTNQEEVPLEEVQFHLYPNLLGGELSISNLQVAGLTVAPTLGLADSLMRVPLASPLQPGEHTTIHLAFTATVPTEIDRNYGILAYTEGVLALAHFFPILAVYDEGGWRAGIPSEQGDLTYADASFYLVRVTAPKKLVLVASGNELDRQVEKNQQVVTFAAGPVRDFYLAASKDYHKQSITVGDVTLNSYAPRRFNAGAAYALEMTQNALHYFSTRYAPYPYTEYDIITISTPAYGVEYPGVTAMAIRIYDLEAGDNDVPNSVYLESTLAHEFGHQYFYNLVGSDQLGEPWLDESLVQYLTWMYYKDRYGPEGEAGFGSSLEARWERVEKENIPIGLPVASYEGREYGAIVYGRGAFFFEELAALMGEDVFDGFIRDYSDTFSWQNATGEDFKDLAEVHCGCDLTPIFKAWVYPEE